MDNATSATEPKLITRDQAQLFPNQQVLEFPDDKVREVAASLGLPTLNIASITAWQFDPKLPKAFHYMITFSSPKLWPISYFKPEKDALEAILSSPFSKISPQLNGGKEF